MYRDILISLRPEHTRSILSGQKTIELRRRPLRVEPGTRVWIYTKQPRGCIEAVAVLGAVHEDTHDELWRRFGTQVAISRSAFDAYLAGTERGYALEFASVSPLSAAIDLKEIRSTVQCFHPPQFFKRLDPGGCVMALLLKRAIHRRVPEAIEVRPSIPSVRDSCNPRSHITQSQNRGHRTSKKPSPQSSQPLRKNS